MIAQENIPTDLFTVLPDSFDTNDQEERIRTALGVAWGPLPEVDSRCLHRYHEYLANHLQFPFDAEYAEDISGYRQLVTPITVLALAAPGERNRYEEFGIVCRARRGRQVIELPLADVELTDGSRNSRLIDDYWFWFWNWRFDPKI